jgi:hypothetical protein
MNLQEEYVHLVSCIGSLNVAWNILYNIKKSHGNSLVNPAFQFALIEYSKPYKKSYGEVIRIHKLGNELLLVCDILHSFLNTVYLVFALCPI